MSEINQVAESGMKIESFARELINRLNDDSESRGNLEIISELLLNNIIKEAQSVISGSTNLNK